MSQIAAALLPALARIVTIPEVTYGVTPTTGTGFQRAAVPPFSFGPIDGMVDVMEAGDTRVNSRDPTLIGPSLLAPTGTLPVLLDIENIDWMLRLIFGNPVQVAGSGPTAGLTQNSYQSGVAVGSDSLQYTLNDEVRRCAGVSCDSFSLPLGKVDGVRQLDCSMIAREVLRNPGAWTPANAPTARPTPFYVPGFASELLVNSVAVPIEDGNLNFANNFVRRQETNNSRFTSDAVGGITSCTGTFSLALRNAAQLAAFQGSSASVSLAFRFKPSATDERRLTFTLPRAFVMVPDLEVSDGPASVTCSFEAKSPLTGSVGMLAAELWHTT
jgi:hypothetical protein